LAFQREGSRGALNPVFAPMAKLPSSPLQAAGLSNGVNLSTAQFAFGRELSRTASADRTVQRNRVKGLPEPIYDSGVDQQS